MAGVPGAKEAKAAMAMLPDMRQAQNLVKAMQGVMSSGGNAFESMQRVMAEATRMLRAERSTLFLRDERTHELFARVAEGDSVVVRSKVSGTHLGVGKLAVNGGMLVGVAPTGKRFVVENIHWYRLRDSAIVEHYAARDDIGMMRQLGLLPAAGLPTAR
jgi:predicted ester cyclase